MRYLIRAIALGSVILACACLPVTSRSPVGSSVGFKPDPALFGVWRGGDMSGNGPGYVTFVKNVSGGMSVILVSPASDRDRGDWEVYDLKAATLGGHRFLSVRELFANDRETNDWPAGATTPLLYRVDGRSLSLYLLDDVATAAAIKSGLIKGTVDPDMRDEHGKVTLRGDVHLTESGVTLDAFMQSPQGLALFKKPFLVLKRAE